ncbi:MAG: DUF883 domain-containing protein [Verrucomicrobia bacterium]|nr:DUF883 domain-containing protein [Verrucomicrobiota bacterium]
MDNDSPVITTEKLQHDLKTLVRDAEELLKAGAGELTERGKEARAKLATAVESARQTCNHLEERAMVGAHTADRLVREHPYESIGVAFCFGLLLGVLANRR